MDEISSEPHILLFGFPAQGHVPQLLNLAELLSTSGLRITFLNTENIHRRFLANSLSFARLAARPRFRFRTISDGLPVDHPRPFLEFMDLEESLRTKCREEYREVLVPDKIQDPDGWPPVTCVVADGMLALASEVPDEIGIPVITYRTSGASASIVYLSMQELIKQEEIPFPEGADLDEKIRGVRSMESFLRRRDLPSFLSNLTDRNNEFLTRFSNNVGRGKALVFNTFESLEAPVLAEMESRFPLIYTIGPLHIFFEDKLNSHSNAKISTSLWKEDKSCISWLDSQPEKSVVYVSFGSVTIMSKDELLEFWHGLINSGQRFLWVLRSDILDGITDSAATKQVLTELFEGTRERGYIVEWAPQQEVLSHKAIGCFLTHCGWNSTLESIAAGVPMICWPFFADQLINSRLVSEVWKVGLDMKDKCNRSILEGMVREMMEGQKGKECRKLAEKMAKRARMSVKDGGSSYVNLQNLIRLIKDLSLKNCSNEDVKSSP